MANILPPYAVVFGPRANCTLEICPIQASVYGYRPDLATNVCFAVLFAIAGIVHAYIGFRTRSWFFMSCLLLGCISAVAGYIGRLFMYQNPWNFAAFMMQTFGIGMSPVFFAAAIYVTLSHSIAFLAPRLSRFPPKLYYWAFLFCDAIALGLQAIGTGLAAKTSGVSAVGINLALAGLGFQVLTIIVFCGLFSDFLIRFYLERKHQPMPLLRVKAFFVFLSLALLLITIRSIFRLYELHQGFRGDSLKNERLFIGMEGVLILISVYCLMIGHPGLAFQVKSYEDTEPGCG